MEGWGSREPPFLFYVTCIVKIGLKAQSLGVDIIHALLFLRIYSDFRPDFLRTRGPQGVGRQASVAFRGVVFLNIGLPEFTS